MSNSKCVIYCIYIYQSNGASLGSSVAQNIFTYKGYSYNTTVIAKVGRFYSVVIMSNTCRISTGIGSRSSVEPLSDTCRSIFAVHYQRSWSCYVYSLRTYLYSYSLNSFTTIIAFQRKFISNHKRRGDVRTIVQECRSGYIIC